MRTLTFSLWTILNRMKMNNFEAPEKVNES